MHLIRPVTTADLDKLVALASQAGPGMVSIRNDPEVLQRRIEDSTRTLAHTDTRPRGTYLFVLTPNDDSEIVGTCGIKSSMGYDSSVYYLRKEREQHESLSLGICREHDMLRLISFENGPSELCDLYLHRSHRSGGLGTLLSLSRLLFIADHLPRFRERIRADMRGVVESDTSRFWDVFGRHIFGMSFIEALDRFGETTQFIPELFPQNPLYLSLLAQETQELLGQVHSTTRPALKMLMDQGFALTDDASLFDGGPQIEAVTAQLKAVTNSRILNTVSGKKGTTPAIISNRRLNYRACMTKISVDGDIAIIASEVLEALQLKEGDTIRALLKD